jgi:hypothetical protein
MPTLCHIYAMMADDDMATPTSPSTIQGFTKSAAILAAVGAPLGVLG